MNLAHLREFASFSIEYYFVDYVFERMHLKSKFITYDFLLTTCLNGAAGNYSIIAQY